MGDFAKRLGQLASKRLESESAQILRTGRANKESLANKLDATLRSGHDMRVFGLGTLASMSSLERYQRFTSSMFHVYSTMEEQLDACHSKSVAHVWKKHGSVLRRADKLKQDLADVGVATNTPLFISPATAKYRDGLVKAGK